MPFPALDPSRSLFSPSFCYYWPCKTVGKSLTAQPICYANNCLLQVKSKPCSLLLGMGSLARLVSSIMRKGVSNECWYAARLPAEVPVAIIHRACRIREKTDSRTWNTLCSKRQNMDTEQWGELSCKEKATKVNDVKAGGRNSGGSLYFRVISFHYPPVFWHIAVLFPMFKVFRKLLLLYSPAPPRMDKI